MLTICYPLYGNEFTSEADLVYSDVYRKRILYAFNSIFIIIMSFFFRIIPLLALICTMSLVSTDQAKADTQKYDLVFTWDKDLNSVLDYKEELETLFEPDTSKHLKIVKKDNHYGVIYDCNASLQAILKVIVKHGAVLQEAGLDQAFAVQDKGYHELFNVSYGYGPNLDAMKKNYQVIYTYLGKSVGKDLYIEQDEKENYMLVYRRNGDRSSTLVVAKRHGRLLRKKGIKTTITEELNNQVVYGESTYLHGEEEIQPASKNEEIAVLPTITAQQTPSLVVLRPEKLKVAIHGNAAKALTPEAIAPVTKPPKTTAELSKASNSHIEKKIERYIKQLRKKGKIRGDEKTGWMVYDLNRDISLVDINADQTFQAASMIKPFLALAFFHEVRQGRLIYGPESRRKMEAMIQRSSNSATNWVMRQIGGPATCQRLLTRHYSNLFKQLHIVEYIPQGGRTYRNKALPSDYIRFLRALWNKELPNSKEIRRLMSLPGRDRLYYGTPIPQGTLVYNKTGTTAHLCGDMGILAPKTKNSERFPYAIVGIIERSSRPSNYKQWMQSRGGVIRQVSTLVYEDLKKKHTLL